MQNQEYNGDKQENHQVCLYVLTLCDGRVTEFTLLFLITAFSRLTPSVDCSVSGILRNDLYLMNIEYVMMKD